MSSGIPNNIEGRWYKDGVELTPDATQLNQMAITWGTGVSAALQANINAASGLVAKDASSNITANNILGGYTTTATAAGTTTLTVASALQQFFTGSTTQTVVLPVTSTLVLGQTYRIVNSSTGAVTVQSSGANTIVVLPAGTEITITCILLSGTSAASWQFTYTGEFASSVTADVAGVSLTDNTPANVTSISLSAGDWDVWGNVFVVIGGVCTQLHTWTSSTSASQPVAQLENQMSANFATGFAANVGASAPYARYNLSATTTIYLGTLVRFSTSTVTAGGGIFARRA